MGTRVAGWTLGCVLAMAGAAGGSAAQAQAKNPGPATAAAAHTLQRAAQVSAKPESGGGMHQGITVHGWWVIEVRRPGGKLYSHTEFENTLVQGSGSGPTVLAAALSGSSAVGGWVVSLSSAASGGAGGACGRVPCYLVSPQFSSACNNLGNCSGSLQTSLASTPAAGTGAAMVLSGQIQSTQAGSIGLVTTQAVVCPYTSSSNAASVTLGTYSPAQCAASPSAESTPLIFTQASLPTAQNVPEAGDTINVTVTISFQ